MDGPWHKVTLQRYTEHRTASGHVTKTYADWQPVWMKLRTLSGTERLQAQQVNAVLTHEASMVYCASIVPHVDHRIVWGTRTFDIKDVRNVDERNEEIRMLASEVQTAGPVSSESPSSSPSASQSGSPSQSKSSSPSQSGSGSPSSSESGSISSSGSQSPSQSASSSPSGSKSGTPSTSSSQSPSKSLSPSPSSSPSS